MATSITVYEVPSGRSLQLDSNQTQLFMNELTRVRGPWWFYWIKWLLVFFTARPVLGPRIQPDFRIEVNRNGRLREYELETGVVLRQKGARIRHQFYFGLLIMRWMET